MNSAARSPREGACCGPLYPARASAFRLPRSLWHHSACLEPVSPSFGEVSVWTTRASAFVALWGIPFIALGIDTPFGRFVVDSYQRSRTFWGLTEQRLMVVCDLTGRHVKNLPLRCQREMP